MATTIERSISSEVPIQPRKAMAHHDSLSGESRYIPMVQSAMKFVSAATMTSSKDMSSNTIPEISDEELLQMALVFEKQQEQQQKPQ